MSTLEQEISAAPLPPTTASVSSEIDSALAARDYERAEQLLARAIERHPTSRQMLTQIAGIFMMDRKPLNAAIALKKAEAFGPFDPHERLQLALAYVAMRRGDWARPELEHLASAGNDPIPTYWLARLDYDDGQYASAIRRLQAVVAKSPTFTRAHDNLALCYEALNRPDEAIPHYHEAVRLNRVDKAPSGWPPLNFGILLRSHGELEEAEKLFREALKYDQRLAPGYYQLGVLLEGRGRMNEAVQTLRRAAAVDADYPQPYYALARIYRTQGHADEAATALATFQRLHAVRREQPR
jgi:tetratricopeptide (TPR) repeat protein